MICRNKNVLWTVRGCIVMVGLGMTFGLIALTTDTQSVTAEFVRSLTIRYRVFSLNPQTPDQLYQATWEAVKINTDGGDCPFFLRPGDIVDLLTTEDRGIIGFFGGGSRKAWISSEDYNGAAMITITPVDSYTDWSTWERQDSRRGFAARDAMGGRRFWPKLIAFIGAGAGTIMTGLFALPFLFIGVVAVAISAGKVSPIPIACKPDQPSTEFSSGGSGNDVNQTTEEGSVLPENYIWPVLVLVGLCQLVLRDGRASFWNWVNVEARGPPSFHRRLVMHRLIPFVLALLFVVPSPIEAKQTLRFQSGEWANGPQGHSVLAVWVVETDSWMHRPSIFLSGKAVEYMALLRVGPTFAGPLVGSINRDDGADGVLGFDIRGRRDVGPFRFMWNGATRHTRDVRIHNHASLGLALVTGQQTIGLAYQPIRTEQPLSQRLAVNTSRIFPWGTLTLEARRTLDPQGRVSLNVDVDIPLR